MTDESNFLPQTEYIQSMYRPVAKNKIILTG